MIKRSLSTVLLAGVMAFNAYGQDHQWKEATSNGYTYKYVTDDPTHSRFYTLKNGLSVILSPTKKDPRIQAYVAVKAGSKTDPATNTGLAHYLEHLLFKGTDKYGTLNWAKEKPELDKIDALYEQYNKTKDEAKRKYIYKQIDSISGVASKYSIANEYDKMMSEMGAQSTNAWTSFEQTVYTDDVPSSAIDKYLTVQAERFRNPVLRIFHTELEAVYEEKNISLDRDGSRVFETIFAELFKNHNYGKQTTIGTVEHLKNPSLVEIRKYFSNYYVPNNMGVVLSGDFNPDEVIAKVDKAFSYMKRKPVQPYTFQPETPISAPIIKEVVGPDAESLAIAYRLPGVKDKDALLAELVGEVLTNGKAGLLDLNLVKKQKLQRASAGPFTLIDHGVMYLSAAPKSGQSLEEVKDLVLNEIENLKKGNFDDDLLPSIINNIKKHKIEATENYNDRALNLVNAFTSEIDWKDQVAYVDNISKLSKADVVAFANKYFGNNYIAVFKRKGERLETAKIEKPEITPVETNADKQSDFVKSVAAIPTTPSQPVFLDYNKDLQKSKLGNAEVLYVQNKENSLYRLSFRYKIGSLNDNKQSLAAAYIQFLGTDKKSAEAISKEFYKIASSFNISTGREYTTVFIEGLQENFTKAVQLYEDLILNAKADNEALTSLKNRLMKARTDAKANKGTIMQGLTNYALYGSKNEFNDVLSNEQVNAIKPEELLQRLKNLNNYEQTVIYYGPLSINELTNQLSKLHKVPTKFAVAPTKKEYKRVEQTKNQVLFADYTMVQSDIRWLRNSGTYNIDKTPMIRVFNNYFGGGMGSLVFQTIRESKALAYSTYGSYVSPNKKNDRYYMLSYVGTQADKFNDATSAMNELLNTLPELPKNLDLAKNQIKKDIQTQRIVQDNIIYNYLTAKEFGLTEDIRKKIYNSVDNITMTDIVKFHNSEIAHKPYTYAVVASKDKLKMEDMQKLGEVKILTLEEIFGY